MIKGVEYHLASVVGLSLERVTPCCVAKMDCCTYLYKGSRGPLCPEVIVISNTYTQLVVTLICVSCIVNCSTHSTNSWRLGCTYIHSVTYVIRARALTISHERKNKQGQWPMLSVSARPQTCSIMLLPSASTSSSFP